MVILFSSARRINPTNPRFAYPIQVPKGAPVRPYSDADAQWHAAELAEAEDRRIDEAARDWADQNSVERGVIYC